MINYLPRYARHLKLTFRSDERVFVENLIRVDALSVCDETLLGYC